MEPCTPARGAGEVPPGDRVVIASGAVPAEEPCAGDRGRRSQMLRASEPPNTQN